MKPRKTQAILALIILFTGLQGKAQPWQWSVTLDSVVSGETHDHPLAFLWIPPGCKQVRGVVIGQHNMLEEGILEHPAFRSSLGAIGFAEVWITPGIGPVFNFNKGDGARFEEMLKRMGQVSGYTELEFAPIVPIGHSAYASYPWNFAAWNPGRTLAILSVHGDAPQTNATGSGQPNPDWGERTIDGVPGLMVMGEYEWLERRLDPAMKYRREHPSAPVSLLADAGHGHFDFSDALVNYLALFITKAAKARLPRNMPLDAVPILKPVDPRSGWLADRWRRDSLPEYPAAPYKKYRGDTTQAFWYFDKQMADATEAYYARARGRKATHIGYLQNGIPLVRSPKALGGNVGRFAPMADGVTFHINAGYTDSLHAGSKISITRICGPVVKLDDTTFSVRFYRMGFNNPKRTGDIWLIASCDGDGTYKSMAQPIDYHIPLKNLEGADQTIDFPALQNISRSVKTVHLTATANKGMPVYYYVKEGPAEIKGDELVITALPPRSKYPVKVTVVAWQYGRSMEPTIKSAEPVSRTFYIN
ncbi:MAG TPA: hypothetical protein VGM41_13480 [Chitinophagaceae bacterium]